jgi:hypothetical protein
MAHLPKLVRMQKGVGRDQLAQNIKLAANNRQLPVSPRAH